MSTHYLIDPFSASGDIIDVTSAPDGISNATGALVIRVPDGVAIHGSPTNMSDLLAAKTAGTLGLYVGFTSVVADACLDGSEIASEASSNVSYPSGQSSVYILGLGVLTTQTQALDFTPTQCIVVWETFSFSDDDDKDGRFTRTYEETPPDGDITCEISFNAGGTYTPTVNGAVMNIPALDQGDQAILRFTSGSVSRVYFGGWSLVY